MEVLVVYQFCTFGGVERVLLSRAIAFRNAGLDIKMSIGYLQDSGALDSFLRYLSHQHLTDRVDPFLVNRSADNRLDQEYDLTLVIDTPEALPRLAGRENLYIECHTPYRANRAYLRKIPADIAGIIVPSDSFRRLIEAECPDLPEVQVLSNPVPDEFYDCPVPPSRVFQQRPIAYLARLDDLKNFKEALHVFEQLKGLDEIMFSVVGQGATRPETYRSLRQAGILGRTFLRNSIPFDKVPFLVGTVKAHRGIFISPSKGDSFGLSVAEFMAGGVPVLISDIPAHRELVDGDTRFLYELGEIRSAARGISLLLEEWNQMSTLIRSHAGKFREQRFIQDWLRLLGTRN